MALDPCVACPATLTHLLDVSGVPLAPSLRRRRSGLWEGPGQSEGPASVWLLGCWDSVSSGEHLVGPA